MYCAWKELLSILPQWIRPQIEPFEKEPLQEIRIRVNSPPELVFGNCIKWLTKSASAADLVYCINTASRYSPWSAATTSQGYITAPGGHRIGVCGEAIMRNNELSGIRSVRSICIRIARDYPDISQNVHFSGKAMLILGAPGWGKTTLLRDVTRTLSQTSAISVVDERGELFPPGFRVGNRMDILSGCPKAQGIEIVLRTMGPECIAVDEITAEEDCMALIHAAYCGVRLIATAHAAGMQDYQRRTVYKPLHNMNLFDTFLILQKDKSFRIEGCSV